MLCFPYIPYIVADGYDYDAGALILLVVRSFDFEYDAGMMSIILQHYIVVKCCVFVVVDCSFTILKVCCCC